MKDDRTRWNRKYQDGIHSDTPSPVVVRHFRRAKKGKALDIACGNGRNALFLAEKGFEVYALDISDVGLGSIPKRPKSLNLICADLDAFVIPAMRFELIVNIHFLSRRLFPYIQEGLASGGILIFETYLEENTLKSDKPLCRDHLLRPNELLRAFLSLRILRYEEKRAKGGGAIASLVGVKTA